MACRVINGGNGRRTVFGEDQEELAAVRRGVIRGAPFGEEGWVKRTARLLGLESALRPRG